MGFPKVSEDIRETPTLTVQSSIINHVLQPSIILCVLEAGLGVLEAGLGVLESGRSCKDHSLTAQIDSRSSRTIPEAPGSCQNLGKSIFQWFSKIWMAGLGVLEAGLGVLGARFGVLNARLGVLERGPGVLEVGPGILEAGLGVLEAAVGILQARIGVVERLGNTSWCIPMRFYKVFGAKTRSMSLNTRNHHFSNRIPMNFMFHLHTELLPSTQNCSPGARHSVFEPGLRDLDQHLGDYCVLGKHFTHSCSLPESQGGVSDPPPPPRGTPPHPRTPGGLRGDNRGASPRLRHDAKS